MNSNDMTDNERCPETVPEEQTGTTKEEKEWGLKREPRPPLPKYIFAAAAALAAIVFFAGSIWYYRTSVLPEKYYQRATAYFKVEEYKEAFALYEKVLKLRPERKNVLFQMAFCLEKIGRPDDAIALYEEHLTLLPGDGRALLRLGWLYSQSGEAERGLSALTRGAEKLKDPYAWALVSEAAIKSQKTEAAVNALVRQTELFKEPEQVLTCSKMLMGLRAWEEALRGYERFSDMTSGDTRGIHGAAAAKAMLGYPTDPRLVILPGKALGAVNIGDTKEEVKEKLGPPDTKEFRRIGGKSLMAEDTAEIWTYLKTMPRRGLSIIFIGESVREAETASAEYKTETGLGLSNFLLAKNKDKLEQKGGSAENVRVSALKGGGLTFYAAGLTDDASDARYKKLRVHKGTSSLKSTGGL